MANDITDNPWILDTASASIIYQPKIFVEHIEFVGYNLDTDQAIIKDRNGRVILILDGADDLEEVRSGKIGIISGIALTTLTAGKVRVFIK